MLSLHERILEVLTTCQACCRKSNVNGWPRRDAEVTGGWLPHIFPEPTTSTLILDIDEWFTPVWCILACETFQFAIDNLTSCQFCFFSSNLHSTLVFPNGAGTDIHLDLKAMADGAEMTFSTDDEEQLWTGTSPLVLSSSQYHFHKHLFCRHRCLCIKPMRRSRINRRRPAKVARACWNPP